MITSALKITAEEDSTLRAVQLHQVERAEGLVVQAVDGNKQRGNDGEVLGHVIGDRERRQRSTGD